ncbi:TldD/PmbA family protein [Methanospirillum stamsii]|uniref:TldD/PmbA family protein n=1 Tax=Methanospirillum stamsii TaxID=1277351 RepID=A0A2V2N938_9EURY|nr:TldD/PmbA family protein [Methanospirillum stamsii]PWR71793.1 TldD/PmbA family protein [Methanospirillum stamsii]
MTVPYRYYDIRRVTGEVTQIDVDNGKVEQAGSSFFDKAVIRVLGDKGWGVFSVSGEEADYEKLPEKLIKEALDASSITTVNISLQDSPSSIHKVPSMKENPADVSLDEKVSVLLDLYKHTEGQDIVSRRINYIEKDEEVSFSDSLGHQYDYHLCRCGFSVMAVASRAGIVQMGYERDHTISGLNIRHRQELASEAAHRAVRLLDAKPSKGGIMKAVLDPELAGVFAHEAVGHASEGDLIKEGSSILKGKINELIGSPLLTIVDNPSLPEFGFCPVDDEGSETKRTEIIKNGVLMSYLHSKETLASIGHGDTGHCRGMPGVEPIVRMSNTFIENGDASYDEIIEECKTGILLKGSRGGQVDPGRGMFQFNAEYGYIIENGELSTMVRDVSLSGEILQTLHTISLIGNDMALHPGYCGKGGQTVPVTDGSPHLLLHNAVVGGCEID